MKEEVVATPARISLGAGSTLSLNHDRLWVIEEGWVEIYLLVDGRRHFAGVFRSGAVLFGVSSDDDSLIMLAPEAARLLPLASAELYAAGASDRLVAARIARALDHWITELSRGILKATTQRPVVSTIAAGETIEASAGASFAAAQGIVWIPMPAGRNLRFLDEVDLVPESRVPLSPATWITLGAPSVLLAHDTSEQIAQGVASIDLRSFHDVLGQLAANRERERSEIDRDSLATSQSFTSESLSSALGRFSGLLTEKYAPHVQGEYEFLLQKLVPDLPATTKLPPGIEFQAALRMLNIKVREVALIGDWWEQDIGRLAATRVTDGRPVALVTDWLGRYFCHCSGEPRRRITASLAADLDTQAASLLAAMPPRKVTAKDLLRTCFRVTKRDFFVLVLATGLASLLGLVLPVAIGYVVDTFVPSHMRDDTIVLGAFVAAVTIAVAVLHFCANIARQRMDGIIEAEIGGKAMERILHLPPKTLKTVSAADLAMRFMSLDQVRRAVMNAGLDIMLTGLFGMSGLVLLFVYSPLGGLIVLSLFILLMAVSVFTGLAQLRAITRGNQITANESSLRLQMIQNVSTLRACAAERRAFSHWAGNAAEMRSRGLRSRLVNAAFKAFVALYPGVALGAVFLALGTKNSDGLSTGSYLAFLTAYQNFSFASLGVAQSVTQLIGLQPTVKRAAFVLAAEPEILAGAKPPGRLSGAITVSRVSFSYSGDTPQILREVDFEAKAGEFVAICGGSGSGKSTLLNLLIGFDRPTEGAIYYDSNDLAQLDLAAVRRQIGLVRQTSRLFGGTIAENIIGAQRASLEDAWFAAEMAGIDGDIRLLPMGMHTVITEGVSTFSGGQLQRLMIARALVSKPKIVFLDEATSALDNIVQSEVTRNIERLGATRIVVAHRLSTVRNADRILFLKNGVIAESGSYDELMAANGAFADFNQRQMLTVPHA